MSYIKPIYYDTLIPYSTVDYGGIDYTVCRDFKHISRYKGLRQIIHYPQDTDKRFIALETPNALKTKASFSWYEVLPTEQNRLDLIAKKFYGSAQYSWVISYMNHIEDGFSVYSGQKIMILDNFMDLFSGGEILASIPAMILNLGSE